MTPAQVQARTSPRHEGGFTLVEVLVALRSELIHSPGWPSAFRVPFGDNVSVGFQLA